MRRMSHSYATEIIICCNKNLFSALKMYLKRYIFSRDNNNSCYFISIIAYAINKLINFDSVKENRSYMKSVNNSFLVLICLN